MQEQLQWRFDMDSMIHLNSVEIWTISNCTVWSGWVGSQHLNPWTSAKTATLSISQASSRLLACMLTACRTRNSDIPGSNSANWLRCCMGAWRASECLVPYKQAIHPSLRRYIDVDWCQLSSEGLTVLIQLAPPKPHYSILSMPKMALTRTWQLDSLFYCGVILFYKRNMLPFSAGFKLLLFNV